MTVNKVILIGNLGADVEVRSTQSGMSVGNIRMATSERRKDKDGNWSDHTEWHRVTLFGKTADNAARFLSKGSQVYIEGKLRTSKWQDKDGNDRHTTEVVCDNMRFLAKKDGDTGGYGGGAPKGDTGKGGGGGYSGSDDDIPF